MTTTEAPSTEAVDPRVSSRRRRAVWRHPVVFSLLLVVVSYGLVQAYQRFDDSRDREPLRAAAAAAENSRRPIAAINTAQVARWSRGDGPREDVVRELVEPGNEFLAPLYFAERGDALWLEDELGNRCYYLAVQPDGVLFDAESTSSVMQICYLDPYATPQSTSHASILD